MDKESRELAVYSFGLLNEQLSAVYLRAREEFLSRLAMSSVTFNTMQGKLENDMHNREVITNFCNLLPTARLSGGDIREHDSYLSSTNIDEIVAQQANTLFVNTGQNSHYAKIAPLYIVGADAQNTRILLAPPTLYVDHPKAFLNLDTAAKEQEEALRDKLVIATLPKRRFAQKFFTKLMAQTDIQAKLYMPNAPAYARALFNKQSGNFEVKKDSPYSLLLEAGRCTLEYISYLPDDDFIAFGVMDHLSNLALTFNKGDELIAVLGDKKPQNETDTTS